MWQKIRRLPISEPVQECLNMDKITLIKMLLASKEENKKILKVNSMPTITSTPPPTQAAGF